MKSFCYSLFSLYTTKLSGILINAITKKSPFLRMRTFWSCLAELNCRPLPYQGSALPTELRQHILYLLYLDIITQEFWFVKSFFKYFLVFAIKKRLSF